MSTRNNFYFYLLSLLLLAACSQGELNNQTKNRETNKSKDIAENSIEYEAAKKVSTDTMSSPLVISNWINHFNSISSRNNNAQRKGFEHFVDYSTENGLALNAILCSFVDANGALWFGTPGGGVSKFEGSKFTNFTTLHGLGSSTVGCITQDKEGNMWFGTDGGGVSVYNGITFTTYTKNDGLSSNWIRDILVGKNGDIYFATDNEGISILRHNQLKRPVHFDHLDISDGLCSNKIRCLCQDFLGRIWIGTQENGVCILDGKSIKVFTESDGLCGNNIRCFLSDVNSKIWIGTEGGGVSYVDSIDLTNPAMHFKTMSQRDGLPGNSVKCFFEDRDQNIWIGTAENGVARIRRQVGDLKIENYTESDGLSSNKVFSIVQDHAGNIWFSTFGGGVCLYFGNAFSHFTLSNGLSNNSIWGSDEDKDGSIWFGTDGNGICLFRMVPSTSNYKIKSVKLNNQEGTVFCAKRDHKGNLWFGTLESGLYKFDGQNLINYTTKQGLVNNMVLCIEEDQQGNMWLGTGSGVSKLSSSNNGNSLVFTNYTTKQGLASEVILSILNDSKGNVWLGTQGGGLSLLKSSIIQQDESHFTNYTNSDGLSNNVINCIYEISNDSLLIGTSNGLNLLQTTHDEDKYKMKIFSTNQGIPDNLISNIIQMPNGKIAVGTNKGIAMFNQALQLDDNDLLKDLEIFNYSTGYPIADVNGQGAMFVDSKGILWAGTGDDKIGLVRLDYNAVQRNARSPKVVIEKIKLNEKDICWYDLLSGIHPAINLDSSLIAQQEISTLGNVLSAEDRNEHINKYKAICFDSITPFYPIPQHLVLPYSHNQITIEFNCIEVSRHNMVNYQYQLEGYDKEWSPVVKKNEAIFGNISEGNYTFKLRAQSPDGVWCEPMLYSFKVLPPWYRTWWAYLLYVGSLISSIVLLFRWRTNALKQREEDLTLLVKERTAEVVLEKREVEKQKEEAEKQFKRSEELLLNILPLEIADELKLKGEVSAKQFQGVTVLFTDFVNFTGISQKLSPQALVSEVHLCYTAFDAIIEKNGLEKIKTIGDAYLAVSGMPHSNVHHAVMAVQAAKDILEFVKQRKLNGGLFDIRIGLNSGPVVAGIVGVKKFAYDIWGDTVNTAARMEQNSELGKVNITGATHELVKDHFKCVYRGKIAAKNKGEIDMYFVE